MDGQLSQDEISALLAGMATDDSNGNAEKSVDPSDYPPIDETLLNETERDAVGEIANISMSTSATTLSSLVNQKVDITTPKVELSNWAKVSDEYERPCVFITIKYTMGVEGSNVLVLKDKDVMVITDLMMGGDGTNISGEVGELQLSAISEAMNQMMGAAATSLSSMTGHKVDISPPVADVQDFVSQDPGSVAQFLAGTFVKISFKMKISNLVDSTLIQLYPIEFAKNLYDTFTMNSGGGESEPEPAPAPKAPAAAPKTAAPASGGVPTGMVGGNMMQPDQNLNVAPAQFQSFSGDINNLVGGANIQLIHDVPLNVTVELGRASKAISEILDFAPGTIIELDKVAGEPVDVLVNGKYVARGEVVVVEESFGVRVTEIIK